MLMRPPKGTYMHQTGVCTPDVTCGPEGVTSSLRTRKGRRNRDSQTVKCPQKRDCVQSVLCLITLLALHCGAFVAFLLLLPLMFDCQCLYNFTWFSPLIVYPKYDTIIISNYSCGLLEKIVRLFPQVRKSC
jgi:hypothetical protein